MWSHQLHVSSGQGLVVGEEHGVVFCVGLVTPLLDPAVVGRDLWAKSADVIAVHVQLGTTVDDPIGQLLSASSS